MYAHPAILEYGKILGMTTDLAETQALLRASTASELSLDDTEAGVFRSQPLPAEFRYEVWRAARAAVGRTGRWPLLVLAEPWAVDLDAPLDEARQRAFAVQAKATDPWSVFDFVWDEPIPAEEYYSYVEHRFPEQAAGLAPQMREELGPAVRELDIDRWLYLRLQEDPALRDQLRLAAYTGSGQWWDPPEARLALLPTDQSWMAPLWAGYGETEEPAALAACLLEWQRTWGADLVAAYPTVLNLSVAVRPVDPEQAWRLAGQLKAVGGSLQMYQYELAFAVMQSDAWSLHDRP